MSTAIRTPITTPRLSRIILEGASAVVASALLAWLFFWFLAQRPNPLAVRAFVAAPAVGEVFYLEADARGLLAGTEGTSSEAGLVAKAVGEAVSTPARSPMVVAISAPTTDLGGVAAAELIGEVARQARRDVLIVLDLAQVANDRDRGVFGNSPYLGMAEALGKMEKPKAKVAVLCSAVPGQRSWMIDGLGRSAFSHFVQVGLAGAARPEGERATRAPIRVEDVHRFVLANTSRWVADHRRGAKQTPTLLAVGPDADLGSFAIPSIPVQPPKPAVAAEPPAKEEAEAKKEKPAGPKPSPRELLLADVLKEWARHEEMARRARAPWRDSPARWRVYQSALLRAERMTRAAWGDPGWLGKAREALELASGQSREPWASGEDPDKDFPIRPIGSDPEAGRALNAALKALTRFVTPELPPLATPKPGPDGIIKAEIPARLETASRGESGPFLEFQLAGWAWRFGEEFGVHPFEDAGRGTLLRQAILARIPAEAALADDRRGIARIAEEIRRGDELRRSAQDDLFGPLDGEGSLKNRIADYGRIYEGARDKVTRFREARATFERIAAKLPSLGEWSILDDLRSSDPAGPAREGALTPRLASAFLASGALAAKLGPKAEPDGLDEARRLAEEKMRALEEAYRLRAQEVLDRPDSWRDLDDVLSTPWLAPDLRRALLAKVVLLDASAPEPISSASASALGPDPGFLREASGLARLEIALRKLGAGEVEGEKLEKARRALPDVARDLADPKGVAESLAGFAEFGRKVREESAAFAFPPQAASIAAGPDPARVAAEVHAADRDVRFRGAEVLRPDTDRAASDAEALARLEAIRFHADRLALDFAADVRRLDDLAEVAFPALKGRSTLARSTGHLALDVAPGPIAIDANKRSATFEVGAKVEGERAAVPVPPGRAFVAVSAPAAKEADPKLPEGGPKPATLVVSLPNSPPGPVPAGGLIPMGLAPRPASFLVSQESSAEPDGLEGRLTARAFYRGRVDGEDGAGRPVVVACRRFGAPITIGIRQDLDAVRRRFPDPPELTRLLTDQFDAHPGKGYLHRNGRLDYILTLANVTPRAHPVTVEQTIQLDDKLAPPVNHRPPRPARLAPRGATGDRDETPGAITADKVPPGKKLFLDVVVKEGGVILASERFTFEQLEIEQYLKFEPKFATQVLEGDEVASPCFVIAVQRSPTDLVFDPIPTRDIKFLINNRSIPIAAKKLKETPNLERGGFAQTILEVKQGVDKYDWTVKVEGHDEKKGTTSIR